MLRIKRASAGSGKTYELAKTYIKLLITSKLPGYNRQFLNDESFKENLSSIMAVTFTVKATAEMKERIVSKLAALAKADTPGLTEKELKKIDYLYEFIEDMGTPGNFDNDKNRVAELARKALHTLLLNYSDFKVQTIDSFFQGILHTFAYEASLDDNFNMEINEDFVNSMGFDSALDSMSEGLTPQNKQSFYWLKHKMEGELDNNRWNVFTRQQDGRGLYSSLINEAKNLGKEQFKLIREGLLKYFSELDRPFSEVVEEVEEANVALLRTFHEQRAIAARELLAEVAKAGLEPSHLYNKTGNYVVACAQPFNSQDVKGPSQKGKGGTATGYSLSKVGNELANSRGLDIAGIDAAYSRWFDINNEYFCEWEKRKKGFLSWKAYKDQIPSLMLMLEIAKRRDDYLKANNSLHISDTTHILSRIIGDTDAPFVYERMGSRLKHYLIDEFQDTSRMQWNNLSPLLHESDSTGNDNLIIGDAKQSIYRFRNADYTLISELDNEFDDIKYYTSEKEPDDGGLRNTNFRSKPRIVEFNNYVFSNIVNLEHVTKSSSTPVFTRNVRAVYKDCIQALPLWAEAARNEPGAGFVELVFYNPSSYGKDNAADEGDEETGNSKLLALPGFKELPGRIMELRSRGYAFSDIGILVNKHEEGMGVVESISAYNSAHRDTPPIPVISEENLLVGSALSVRVVIQALREAAEGLAKATRSNPVLSDPVDESELMKLLSSLQSLALPSVVEAIIATFVPRRRRDAEAPFLAAFQDAVIEYTNTHSSDIGSFLKWWDLHCRKLSITSPEDSEGVRLLTIHKSKGLEFPCVIIPKCGISFTPRPKLVEWRWVPVSDTVEGHGKLPPVLPVLSKASLSDTAHSAELEKYLESYSLDELNKLYVAFTRASKELYAYIPRTQKSPTHSAGGALTELLTGIPEGSGLEGKVEFTMPDELGRQTFRYGEPTPEEVVKAGKEKELSKQQADEMDIIPLDRYSSGCLSESVDDEERASSPVFRNDNPLKTIVYPDGDEEEIDPRAEGTLQHRIMQMVDTPDDLDKSLRRMAVEGLIAGDKVQEWGERLREAMKSVEAYGWFAPGMRVLNERPVVRRGLTWRPDRVVVDDAGNAVVVDYKFGEHTAENEKQVARYAKMLSESGRFNSVRAYLWYVPKSDIKEVEY